MNGLFNTQHDPVDAYGRAYKPELPKPNTRAITEAPKPANERDETIPGGLYPFSPFHPQYDEWQKQHSQVITAPKPAETDPSAPGMNTDSVPQILARRDFVAQHPASAADDASRYSRTELCSKCGEIVLKGVSYHKRSDGERCIIDVKRARMAGLFIPPDVPLQGS